MAIVETTDTINPAGIDENQWGVVPEQTKWQLELPDFTDPDATALFVTEVHESGHNNMRGIKTLRTYLKKYLYSTRLAEKHLHQVKVSLNTINGVTFPRDRTDEAANQQRRLKRTTTKFYNSLNTAGLRKQCQLFGLDYDSYDDQETIINELVSKNMEMVG